jgi:hypothetical protein
VLNRVCPQGACPDEGRRPEEGTWEAPQKKAGLDDRLF